MNVLVLFSGASSSFNEEGCLYPKNLSDVGGKPLVQVVLNHLSCLADLGAKFICVIRRDENRSFHTGTVVRHVIPSASIIEISSETAGAACSALMAVDLIGTESPLVIVNGDQLLHDVDLSGVILDFQRRSLDGATIVFEDFHPRWSFVKCCDDGFVTEAAEKRPISKTATAGFYYFARGVDFVSCASAMLKKGASVNNRFYICPVFNEMVLLSMRIGVYKIPKEHYHSFSTPADLQSYNERFFRV
jgi:dTDP-glucose pyrophosphorylase